MLCTLLSFHWLPSPTKGFAEGAEIWLTIAFFLATAAVVVGLIGEYREDKCGSWWAAHALLAEMLVLGGIAGELFFEGGAFWYSMKLHALDEALITQAQTDAGKAVKQAADLGVTYQNLDSVVQAQTTSVNEAVGHIDDVDKTLIAASNHTAANAAKVRASLDAARKEETEMAASVATIDELRKELHDVTTPRALTDPQAAELTKAAKPFQDITFDMAASHDSDAPQLAGKIAMALHDANWNWTPRVDLGSIIFKGLPPRLEALSGQA
jgi:hypothetical protein